MTPTRVGSLANFRNVFKEKRNSAVNLLDVQTKNARSNLYNMKSGGTPQQKSLTSRKVSLKGRAM